MEDSILTTTKKLLGIAEDYTEFDTDIIIDINSVFAILNQLGIGPEEGFTIEDASTTWDEYICGDLLISEVKTYMYMKVRMMFDPPTSGTLIDNMNKQIAEFEWRLNVAVDPE